MKKYLCNFPQTVYITYKVIYTPNQLYLLYFPKCYSAILSPWLRIHLIHYHGVPILSSTAWLTYSVSYYERKDGYHHWIAQKLTIWPLLIEM